MGMTEPELKDLSSAGVYIAGFTDPDCVHRKDYYDLFVSIPAKSFTIAEHAKEHFILTKFHKTTGDSFVKAAESQTDGAVIKTIAAATKGTSSQQVSTYINVCVSSNANRIIG
jgi:hypothetical protein